MKLATHECNGVMVIDAKGKITLGEATNDLRTRILALLAVGWRRFVLNLADVSYLDSAALGELIAARAVVTELGGEMKLYGLSKRNFDLLVLTKLHTVFEAFDTETEALASFALQAA